MYFLMVYFFHHQINIITHRCFCPPRSRNLTNVLSASWRTKYLLPPKADVKFSLRGQIFPKKIVPGIYQATFLFFTFVFYDESRTILEPQQFRPKFSSPVLSSLCRLSLQSSLRLSRHNL